MLVNHESSLHLWRGSRSPTGCDGRLILASASPIEGNFHDLNETLQNHTAKSPVSCDQGIFAVTEPHSISA